MIILLGAGGRFRTYIPEGASFKDSWTYRLPVSRAKQNNKSYEWKSIYLWNRTKFSPFQEGRLTGRLDIKRSHDREIIRNMSRSLIPLNNRRRQRTERRINGQSGVVFIRHCWLESNQLLSRSKWAGQPLSFSTIVPQRISVRKICFTTLCLLNSSDLSLLQRAVAALVRRLIKLRIA